MTLTAIVKGTETRIVSTDYEDIRIELDRSLALVCPITGLPVVPVRQHFRKDNLVSSHFRIKGAIDFPEDLEFDSEYFKKTSGRVTPCESAEHREGKALVLASMSEIDSVCTKSLGVFEKRVYLPGKEKYRVIDVAFELPSGLVIAHEVQLASITVEQLEVRTNDYWECGIDVRWWFGKAADTDQHRDWHYSKIGEAPFVFTFESGDPQP